MATGKVASASVDPKRPFVSMWNRVARYLFSSLVPSCPVTSCLLFSCTLLFRHSLSCLVPPCPVTSCLLFSCPLFSRHLLSSLLLSPLVPSHLALSPLVLRPLVFSSCIACRRVGFVRSRLGNPSKLRGLGASTLPKPRFGYTFRLKTSAKPTFLRSGHAKTL